MRTEPSRFGASRIGPPRAHETGFMPNLPSKPCVACGRTIEWRKKWERDWEAVKFCSRACRSAGSSARDPDASSADVSAGLSAGVGGRLESAILSLLAARASGATICPSEAAKAVGDGEWRALMEPARAAARRLVVRGTIEITQGGRPVDPSTARGPIRLRLVSVRPTEPARVARRDR